MDEFSAAQVKTAVGGAFVVGLEEHQVAGDKFFGAFGAQPQLVLLVSGAGDADAVLVEDVLQVAGAVKGLGGGAAELVGDTYVGFGCGYQGGYFVFGQDGLAVGSHGAFGVDATAGFLLLYICAPGAGSGLGFFQGSPGGVVHDACDTDLLVLLEFGHGLLGLGAVYAVKAAELVTDAVQLLLQQHHLVPVAALLQGGRSCCRHGGGGEHQPYGQGNKQGSQVAVMPPGLPALLAD